MSYKQLQRDISDDIRREKRSVLCVGAEADAPAFAYYHR
jgi:hypothetical protein